MERERDGFLQSGDEGGIALRINAGALDEDKTCWFSNLGYKANVNYNISSCKTPTKKANSVV